LDVLTARVTAVHSALPPPSGGTDPEEPAMAHPAVRTLMTEIPYTVAPERLAPIPPEAMTPAQQEAAAEISAGPRGRVIGPFWPLLRSPGLTKRVQKVGEYIRWHCTLDFKLNEFAALIGARAWNQQYEWWAHTRHALSAGVKPSVVDAIAEGRRPTEMTADEEIVYDFVTELLANHGVSDATYARTVGRFGEEQMMDLIGIVGYYTMLAMVMNVARTAIPDGTPLPLAPAPGQVTVKR